MGGLHSISSGEVVVLAGVDDDAGITVDDTGEVLVDEGTLRVDVAEEDALQRVVQHHVQALQCAHGRDFRHTKS